MKISRMSKIAGAGLLGFCALSLGFDKANLAPVASQAAGFVGAFLGSLAAQKQQNRKRSKTPSQVPPDPPRSDS